MPLCVGKFLSLLCIWRTMLIRIQTYLVTVGFSNCVLHINRLKDEKQKGNNQPSNRHCTCLTQLVLEDGKYSSDLLRSFVS